MKNLVILAMFVACGLQAQSLATEPSICTADQMKICSGCAQSVPYCCVSGVASRGCSKNVATWKSGACKLQCKIPPKMEKPKEPVVMEPVKIEPIPVVEIPKTTPIKPVVVEPESNSKTPDGVFPADGETLSIQYKNSTDIPIIVWLDNQAFCAKSSNQADCKQGDDAAWDKNLGKFFIYTQKNGQWVASPGVSGRKQRLEPGQVWRITPPVDEKNSPYWCFDQPSGPNTWKRNCPGVGSWVTKDGITMRAIEKVTRFEYNINTNPRNMGVYFNQSAVDGNNLNATMEYTGSDCPNNKRVCLTDLNTCPYPMKADGAMTCPSPKFWPSDVIQKCGTSGAGKQWNLSPRDLVGCGYGDREHKIECHKWWALNECGQAWLSYLQKKNRCESYGWAYDEMRWDPSQGDNFDFNGNPKTNSDVHTLIRCPFKPGPASININVTNIMR